MTTTQKSYLKEVAITGLVVIELAAIWRGMDGMLLTAVVAVIAGLAGYTLSKYEKEKT